MPILLCGWLKVCIFALAYLLKMTINTKFFATVFCVGLVLFSACKKKDDDSTKPILHGSVKFQTLPTYVQKGETFHIEVSGAYRAEDGSTLVGYRYYDPLKAQFDTLRAENKEGPVEFDFTISKDTTGTFSLVVYAFADGYYGQSASSTFTIVNTSLGERGSLSQHPYGKALSSSFTDSRDGSNYYTFTAAELNWMAQNLAYKGSGNVGRSFSQSEAMDALFGRFYSYDEALTACPEGWRLPTEADFVALCGGTGVARQKIEGAAPALKGNVYFNNSRLWSYQNASISINNSTLFTALPLGYVSVAGDRSSQKDYLYTAAFWTAEEYDAELALLRYLKVDSNDLFVEAMDKNLKASVRCVKDTATLPQ